MSELKLDDAMIDDLFEKIVATCKENNIGIVEPKDMGVYGGKIGSEADHQLNISHEIGPEKYSFNFGPASRANYTLSRSNAIAEFVQSIVGVSRNFDLQFVSLVVPRKAVEKADQVKKDNIFIRYIVDYVPVSDSLAERWDVLIKKVAHNA